MSTVCGCSTSQTAATSAAATTGARRAGARRDFRSPPSLGRMFGGGGAARRARGGAAIEDESRSTMGRLTGQERGDAIYHARLLVPAPERTERVVPGRRLFGAAEARQVRSVAARALDEWPP